MGVTLERFALGTFLLTFHKDFCLTYSPGAPIWDALFPPPIVAPRARLTQAVRPLTPPRVVPPFFSSPSVSFRIGILAAISHRTTLRSRLHGPDRGCPRQGGGAGQGARRISQ